MQGLRVHPPLTDRVRRVLEDAAAGVPVRVTAEHLGVSRQRVRQLRGAYHPLTAVTVDAGDLASPK